MQLSWEPQKIDVAKGTKITQNFYLFIFLTEVCIAFLCFDKNSFPYNSNLIFPIQLKTH